MKGQNHITQTLINSIKNNKIAHAYLLTGTRGIGKTTIARIFAKAIRCENLSSEGEPCLTCNSCLGIDSGNSLDYLEIDGASNNSVDNIRELIDNVQYLPSSGKYKVYVIDEVHMLTVNAFNALLKTLEEPPEHVIFIFATTDPQKLLGTVLSRCQRFDFKNSSVEETKNLLLKISQSEGIEFENDGLIEELAKQGKGSFRDSLSLLDQVISLSEGNRINEDILMLSLGMAKVKSINLLTEAILSKNKNLVLSIFNEVKNENIDFKIFAKQILDKLYDLLINLDDNGNILNTDLNIEIIESVTLPEIMWVYENLSKDLEWALNSFDPEKACSFTYVKMALREKIIVRDNQTISVKESEKKKDKAPVITKLEEEPVITAPIQKPAIVEAPPVETPVEKTWENFIKYLYRNHKSLAVNIERGNILNSNSFNQSGSEFEVGFTQECKIFFDYLSEHERKLELTESISNFLGVDKEKVNYSLQIIDEQTKEEKNFRSAVELVEDAEEKIRQDQTDSILSNKFIKEAQDLFNSKIDKVILNKDK